MSAMQAAAMLDGGPLSPSSYLDFTALEDGSNSSSAMEENSNAMDLLRYYIDMQQQSQQSQNCAALQTPTINMSEIEHQQQQQQQQQPVSYNGNSLFPFADASPIHQSAPLSPPALPPSAFAAGSELPLQMDPSIWSSFMPAAFNQTQPKIEEDAEPAYVAPQTLPQMPPPEPIVAATGSNSKKRARSSQPVETIEEAREEERQSEEEDEDADDDDEHNDASFGSTTRNTRSGQRKVYNRAAPAATSTTSNGKRAVSVSSSTTSSAPVTRPSKKAATSSTHPGGGQTHPHALVPVPEWDDKLSKAEYDKLSSKEKRQMRNKISARNFRHRRKAHIDTLEAEINDKNAVIGVLQNEVGALRTENTDLRADIEMLKKNWESIAAKISMASAPAAPVASTSAVPSSASISQPALSPDEDDLYGAPSLPALSPPSSSASTNGDMETELSFGTGAGEKPLARPSTSASASASTSSSSVRRTTRNSSNTHNKQAKPNLRKDLSSATGNGFWDSSSPFSSSFRGFGAAAGGMDVHTTFVPDLASTLGSPIAALSEKRENGLDHFGSNNNAFGQRYHHQQQQPTQSRNMNPALNALSQEQINSLREQFGSSSAFGAGAGANDRNNTIDSRDRARLLAGKDALSSSSSSQDDSSAQSSFFEANPFLLLRGDAFQEYRGQLYSKLANNAAGIASSQSALKAGLSSPPEGLKPAFFAPSAAPAGLGEGSNSNGNGNKISDAQLLAGVAAIAQKTLFEKLSTAFWDAFSGQSSQLGSGNSMLRGEERRKHVDGQKVADVLSGKSRLEVVSNIGGKEDEQTGLEETLEKLALRK